MMAKEQTTTITPPQTQRRRLPDLWQSLTILLAVGLVISIWIWKPWQANIKASERTVSVTGSSTVKAEPDQFVFNPSYEFVNADKAAALSAMTKKSDEIVVKLRSLGVADNKIKTNAADYQNGIYFPDKAPGTNTYTLSLTVTVGDKTLAQKVQDYLVSTTPSGAVSPQAGFSEDKRKKLEAQARDDAEKDARTKAERSAKNVGYKLGEVKSVSDSSGFGFPMMMDKATGSSQTLPAERLSIQPGENDFSFSVQVVYFIR